MRGSPYDLLLPRPRDVRPLGGGVNPAILDRPAMHTPNHDLRQSAYILTIEATGVRIESGDVAGSRHAEATLGQVRRIAGCGDRSAQIPAVRIEDAPALAKRGMMLDVSRCRIPQMPEFASIIETLAGLKFNHLQCYTEHAFAYTCHPTAWAEADPITPDEARTLGALCDRHGIELAANQNCFGHLTRWLELPEFAHLAETHGDWIFAGMPRSGPFSLCPTDPGSLRFVERLLDEILPCFSSGLVNIGCDETYDVGQGRSAEVVEREGKAAVYGRFVGAVCEAVMARGKTPMFWGDIAREHPRALESIPAEAHALVWGYEPGHGFDAEGALHREHGRPWWVCPGTSAWRGFTGRSAERRANIREAAAAGVSGNADGMLLTDWGDLGHRQVWPIVMLAIAEAADAAWTGNDRSDRFLDAAGMHLFGDPSGETARWIEELGDVDEPIRARAGVPTSDGDPTRLLNASALFTELHPPPLPLGLPEDAGPWRGCADRLEDLARRVPTGAGPLVEAELWHAVMCARWACDIALSRRGEPIGTERLEKEREAIKREHARLWTHRSRPGGLPESLGYWDQIEVQSV